MTVTFPFVTSISVVIPRTVWFGFCSGFLARILLLRQHLTCYSIDAQFPFSFLYRISFCRSWRVYSPDIYLLVCFLCLFTFMLFPSQVILQSFIYPLLFNYYIFHPRSFSGFQFGSQRSSLLLLSLFSDWFAFVYHHPTESQQCTYIRHICIRWREISWEYERLMSRQFFGIVDFPSTGQKVCHYFSWSFLRHL